MLIDHLKSRDNGKGVVGLPGPIRAALDAPAAAAPDVEPIKPAQIETRIDALLQRMTLQEKLGQLTQYAYGMATGRHCRSSRPAIRLRRATGPPRT